MWVHFPISSYLKKEMCKIFFRAQILTYILFEELYQPVKVEGA